MRIGLRTHSLRRTLVARGISILLLAYACALALAQSDALSRSVKVDIAPQPLAAALIEFSKQTGIQVVTAAPAVQNLMSRAVKGELPTAVAPTGMAMAFAPIAVELTPTARVLRPNANEPACIACALLPMAIALGSPVKA